MLKVHLRTSIPSEPFVDDEHHTCDRLVNDQRLLGAKGSATTRNRI